MKDLDKQFGTTLGKPVKIADVGKVEVSLGEPVPAAKASEIDDWIFSGGHKRKRATKKQSTKRGRRRRGD